jgi:hypothetical protein
MRRVLAMAMLGALAACGADKVTAPPGTVSGNFTLRTIGGGNLPAIIAQDATGKIEITAGNLNFNTDKTWSGSLTARVTITGGGVTTQTSPGNGTYTMNGSAIVFHDVTDGSDYTGTISGNTLNANMDLGLGVLYATVWQK